MPAGSPETGGGTSEGLAVGVGSMIRWMPLARLARHQSEGQATKDSRYLIRRLTDDSTKPPTSYSSPGSVYPRQGLAAITTLARVMAGSEDDRVRVDAALAVLDRFLGVSNHDRRLPTLREARLCNSSLLSG
jgi:hypothetical protein